MSCIASHRKLYAPRRQVHLCSPCGDRTGQPARALQLGSGGVMTCRTVEGARIDSLGGPCVRLLSITLRGALLFERSRDLVGELRSIRSCLQTA